MSGLYHTLGVGAESLFTSMQGVDTAGHNIANAQTEGYSRQRVNAVFRIPSESRGLVIGNGVVVDNITRAHDRFLEKQLNEVHQDFGEMDAKLETLKRMEGIYSPELDASVADEIGSFFNALQDLSSFPDELITRTNVVETADNLINTFRRIDDSLRVAKDDINGRIQGEVEEINVILTHIAELNRSISTLEAGKVGEANDLRDQQDRLLRDLTQRFDINYYRSDNGMLTIRGPGETLLVDRSFKAEMVVSTMEDRTGMFDLQVIESSEKNPRSIRGAITTGRLKSLFDIRDNVIEDLLFKNNSMVKGLADNINIIHRKGHGLNDFNSTTGRDFFALSDDINFAARSVKVSDIIAGSTDAISVASTPNAPGDNVLGNELVRLQNTKIMEGGRSTLNEYYANYVGSFGLEVVRAQHDHDATQVLQSELKARRESVAGVSLDEEATNLLKWQSNYTASSKVITTVDEMLETVLGLKR